MRALYEPWGLGDAVIAAATAREMKDVVLICNSKWHSILKSATVGPVGPVATIELRDSQATYASRDPSQPLITYFQSLKPAPENYSVILSVRGDFRDAVAAKMIYPKAPLKISGWNSFLARHLGILDWLYRVGILKVQNRYIRWAKIAGVDFNQIEQRYRQMQLNRTLSEKPPIAIHLGAQWRSRQYPFVAELKSKLTASGYPVQLIAGPTDVLPNGVSENEVLRPKGADLVEMLKKYEIAIVNDSGPMHLAAYSGLKTLAIALISNIEEWLPPLAISVNSKRMPKGYRPLPQYTSDEICEGWPTPEEVIAKMNAGFRT